MTMCSIEGCGNNKVVARGWCDKHYSRWKRHGDPSIALKDHTPPEVRWRKCYRVDRNGCWIWTGPASAGRGLISCGAGNQRFAHVFVWEQFNGPVPKGKELDHKCRVTLCIRPAHLEAVTHAINMQRGDVGILNAAKTHCKYGHEFTPENTYVVKGRWRQCRTCMRRTSREAQRRYRAGTGRPAGEPITHCKQGHELTPENVRIQGKRRRCLECLRRSGRETMRKYRAENRSGTARSGREDD